MIAARLPVAVAAGFAFASFGLCAESKSGFNVDELVKQSVIVNTADWKAQPEYSHCSRSQNSKIDASGNVSAHQSKTFETMMIDGSPYDRLIAISNEPLPPQQQQQEQMKLNSEIARRASETHAQRQARIAKYQSSRAEEHMLMQQMVQAFTFTLVGEQTIEGVDCYVLDAQPNPAYVPPIQKARVLEGMRGRLWIDKEHYHWVKVRARVTNPVQFGLFVAKVKPGTQFELEQAPVGDVWLPKHFSESVNASVFGIYSMRTREDDDYSGYHSILLSAKTQSGNSGGADSANLIARRPVNTHRAEIAAH